MNARTYALLLALAVIISFFNSGCAAYTPDEAFAIHDKLVENNCYEKHSLKTGHYVTVLPTDLCLSIAYPEK